jgi:hypothetical protein
MVIFLELLLDYLRTEQSLWDSLAAYLIGNKRVKQEGEEHAGSVGRERAAELGGSERQCWVGASGSVERGASKKEKDQVLSEADTGRATLESSDSVSAEPPAYMHT